MTRSVKRGAIRCEVAADVAEEALEIAEHRELAAKDERDRTPQDQEWGGSVMRAAMLEAEARALRSMAYAIRKHNVQP